MAQIRKLSQATIARIAAGEIIDRPASILRELLDNALDAGAKSIDIRTQGGGIDLIVVADDGGGIVREDLALALQQSATSKITDDDDLFAVATLGFRGEALASIAAAADVVLKSKSTGADHAFEIEASAGGVSQSKPTALAGGTRVEVRDLFLRIPARRRFLKSVQSENQALRATLVRAALAAMTTTFTATFDNRKAHLPGADWSQPHDQTMRARLSELMGAEFAQAAKYIDIARGELRLRGFLCPPSVTRTRRDRQHLIVNGRPVVDTKLALMVQKGYGDTLYGHRHPQWVLYLDLPTRDVDVNVHPAKAHIRLRNEQAVLGQVLRMCEEAVAQMRAGTHTDARSARTGQHERTLVPVAAGTHTAGVAETSASYRPQPSQQSQMPTAPAQAGLSHADFPRQVGDGESPDYMPHLQDLGRAIGQVGPHGFAEHAGGVLVIDIHAAHERVLYERLKKSFVAEGGIAQPLVQPLHFEVSRLEADGIEDRLEEFAAAGIDLVRAGVGRLELHGVPEVLVSTRGFSPEALVRRLLEDDGEGDPAHIATEQGYELLAEIACKSAIKAGDAVDMARLERLLRDMEATPRSGYCNHGRPTWTVISHKELDSYFLRGR